MCVCVCLWWDEVSAPSVRIMLNGAHQSVDFITGLSKYLLPVPELVESRDVLSLL